MKGQSYLQVIVQSLPLGAEATKRSKTNVVSVCVNAMKINLYNNCTKMQRPITSMASTARNFLVYLKPTLKNGKFHSYLHLSIFQIQGGTLSFQEYQQCPEHNQHSCTTTTLGVVLGGTFILEMPWTWGLTSDSVPIIPFPFVKCFILHVFSHVNNEAILYQAPIVTLSLCNLSVLCFHLQ